MYEALHLYLKKIRYTEHIVEILHRGQRVASPRIGWPVSPEYALESILVHLHNGSNPLGPIMASISPAPRNRYFVYGSFRKGHYNHVRFGFTDNVLFVNSAVLCGAQMYDLGDYPCIVLTHNPEHKVIGEIYEFCSESLEQRICHIEIGAGYSVVKALIGAERVRTFVFDSVPDEGLLVDSGDWDLHCGKATRRDTKADGESPL